MLEKTLEAIEDRATRVTRFVCDSALQFNSFLQSRKVCLMMCPANYILSALSKQGFQISFATVDTKAKYSFGYDSKTLKK